MRVLKLRPINTDWPLLRRGLCPLGAGKGYASPNARNPHKATLCSGLLRFALDPHAPRLRQSGVLSGINPEETQDHWANFCSVEARGEAYKAIS